MRFPVRWLVVVLVCQAPLSVASADERALPPSDGEAVATGLWRAACAARALRADPSRTGALAGRRIAVSPGHGTRYDGGWSFQREVTQDLREDIHTNEVAIDYLLPMLERAGADVVHLRERAFRSPEQLLDDDDGAPAYTETGVWETSATPGFGGGTYRFSYVDATGTASARWGFTVPVDGVYPVYVYFLASANRSRAATYRIEHFGGASVRVLDQGGLRVQSGGLDRDAPPPSDAERAMNARWHYLGSFPFVAGEPGAIALSNGGADSDTVVIADAVRVGADTSGVAYDGIESGRPRWEEAAFPFLAAAGAPAWVFPNDVRCRPLYAAYEGVDAYFSLHTNCCSSSGTSTYTWYPEMWVPESSWPARFAEDELPPGTYEWSDAIHDSVIGAIRATWDADWPDQGHLGADFGELRPLRNGWRNDVAAGNDPPLTVPAALMEVAFHDTAYDASLIREQGFRQAVARAICGGMIRAFEGDDALVPPLAPAAVAAWSTPGGVRVAWRPAEDPVEAHAAPSAYRVYVSPRPDLFPTAPALETAALVADLDVASCASVYVRVTAMNAAGESLDGPTVGARRAPQGVAPVLWVNGVDREVKTVRDPNSLRDWARVYGPALADAGGGRGFFAMATDDAVAVDLVALADFAAVVWATGETSNHDGSLLAAERAAVAAYVAGGGRIALSGAELGWDLVEYPTEDSASFLSGVLHADYLSDDAESTRVEGVGPLAGIGPLTFGGCDGDGYCVEWPDILGPLDGGRAILTYAGTSDAAAVLHEGDGARAAVFGFPLETIDDDAARHDVLVAVVDLLAPELADATYDCREEPPVPDAPGADVSGPREDVVGPREDVVGPREDVVGPREDVPGPREDVTGPRPDVPTDTTQVPPDLVAPWPDTTKPGGDLPGLAGDGEAGGDVVVRLDAVGPGGGGSGDGGCGAAGRAGGLAGPAGLLALALLLAARRRRRAS